MILVPGNGSVQFTVVCSLPLPQVKLALEGRGKKTEDVVVSLQALSDPLT